MTRPLVLLGLFLPSLASAATVVIAPIVGGDAKSSASVTAMLSSELSFMPGVDDVTELPTAPATLNTACLGSTSCLGAIAKGKADTLITGALVAAGGSWNIDLVYYDARTNKIVRRRTFTTGASPEAVADKANSMVKELLSGDAAAAPAPAKPATTASTTTSKAPPAMTRGDDDGEMDLSGDFNFDEEIAKPAPAKPAPSTTKPATTTSKPATTTSKPAPAAASSDGEDDFEFDVAADDAEAKAREAAAARAKAEADAKARADAEARRRAEEDARAKAAADARAAAEAQARAEAEAAARAKAEADAAARAKADAAARARAQAEAQARAEEEARAAAVEDEQPAFAADEEFDPNAFTFGSAAGKIETVEEISFAPSRPTSSSTSTQRTSSSTSSSTTTAPKPVAKTYYDEEEVADFEEEEPTSRASAPARDLDEEEDRRPAPPPKDEVRPGSSRTTIEHDSKGGNTLHIALRGGYANYYGFHFVTVGGELQIAAAPTVFLLGGIESYNVQRQIPPEQLVAGQPMVSWNTIYPMNAGIVWKSGTDGIVRPFAGADAIFAAYYFDANRQASWAVGGRARVGADFMASSAFGVTVNASVGAWHGADWTIIQRDTKATGLVPQISAGTLLAF